MNNPSKRFNFLIFLLVMIAAMMLLSGLLGGESYKKIGYSEMRTLFLEEKVESFEWEDGVLTLKLNAPEAKLSEIVAALPALHAPTVNKLHDAGWFAVESVVEEKLVRDLIPVLSAAGATGIIELPLNKIIF